MEEGDSDREDIIAKLQQTTEHQGAEGQPKSAEMLTPNEKVQSSKSQTVEESPTQTWNENLNNKSVKRSRKSKNRSIANDDEVTSKGAVGSESVDAGDEQSSQVSVPVNPADLSSDVRDNEKQSDSQSPNQNISPRKSDVVMDNKNEDTSKQTPTINKLEQQQQQCDGEGSSIERSRKASSADTSKPNLDSFEEIAPGTDSEELVVKGSSSFVKAEPLSPETKEFRPRRSVRQSVLKDIDTETVMETPPASSPLTARTEAKDKEKAGGGGNDEEATGESCLTASDNTSVKHYTNVKYQIHAHYSMGVVADMVCEGVHTEMVEAKS